MIEKQPRPSDSESADDISLATHLQELAHLRDLAASVGQHRTARRAERAIALVVRVARQRIEAEVGRRVLRGGPTPS